MSTMKVNHKIFRNKPNSDEEYDRLISLIQQLPSPKVIEHFDQGGKIDPKKTILCFQHEMAYLDSYHVTEARYIGSKSVHDCVLLYLYTESDHCVLHVDIDSPIELLPSLFKILRKFNDLNLNDKNCLNELHVSLAGGHSSLDSKRNVINILRSLFSVMADFENLNIIFDTQLVMNSNHVTEESRLRKCYDLLIQKLRIISHAVNIPLREEILQNLSPKNLQQDIDNNIASNQIGIRGAILNDLALMFWNAKACYDPNDEVSKKEYELFNYYLEKLQIKNESHLLQLIKFMFNKQFYEKIRWGVDSGSYLSNFVFDIRTGNIITIPNDFKSTFETEREVAFYTNGYEPRMNTYFLCYDGKSNDYINPNMKSSITLKLESLHPTVDKKPCMDFSLMREMCVFPLSDNHVNSFFRYSQLDNKSTSNNNENNNFFKSPYQTYVQENYLDRKDEISCQNLNLLKTINNKFFAKMRQFPEYTVDAMLPCDSLSEGKRMQQCLESHNIPVRLLRFNDKNVICVPGINIATYGQIIDSSLSRTFR